MACIHAPQMTDAEEEVSFSHATLWPLLILISLTHYFYNDRARESLTLAPWRWAYHPLSYKYCSNFEFHEPTEPINREREMVCTPCTCALTLLFTVELILCLTSDWRCPGSTGEKGKRAFMFTSMIRSLTVIYFEFHEPTEPVHRERDGTHTMHLRSNVVVYHWINLTTDWRCPGPAAEGEHSSQQVR